MARERRRRESTTSHNIPSVLIDFCGVLERLGLRDLGLFWWDALAVVVFGTGRGIVLGTGRGVCSLVSDSLSAQHELSVAYFS